MTTSIVIPNYNGENLLLKNLPTVLVSSTNEVIVLDDGSSDKSLEILEGFRAKNPKLKILKHQKNLGFIPSVNDLFKEAVGEIVILLNSDVLVSKDFLEPLLKHFDNKKVFAVNLHEKGNGPAIAFWKDGFYEFKNGQESNTVKRSAWASGGSAAYRKEIWQVLGGFDKNLAPFYWEDVDISCRALKLGYDILWEPQAKVDHEHESTIKKINQRYVRWARERNQLLFIWKNITDPKLKSEHRNALIKKLLSPKIGYWIPFLWALMKNDSAKDSKSSGATERTDLEVINYAS